MSENTTLERVSRLVTPILSDLRLELYDLEFRGGTLRITVDTPPGSDGGVDLEAITLATRLISREFDHEDPVPGHYTLEVTSPGLERSLRTPAHFQRELGKTVALRLRDIGQSGERRLQGELIAADARAVTVRLDQDPPVDPRVDPPAERTVPYEHIDRARTVFVWGPAPKPGRGAAAKGPKGPAKTPSGAAKRSSQSKSGSVPAGRKQAGAATATHEEA